MKELLEMGRDFVSGTIPVPIWLAAIGAVCCLAVIVSLVFMAALMRVGSAIDDERAVEKGGNSDGR